MDSVLYRSDIDSFVYKGLSARDSAEAVKKYVERWAKRQLLLHKAHINMPPENKTIEKLVRKYKEDLQISFYKEALLDKQLDTVIAARQILSYYNTYKQNFKTKERLIRYKYILMDRTDSKKKNWINLLDSNKKEHVKELAQAVKIFKKSYLKDSIWIPYEDFLQKIPFIKKSDKMYSGKFFKHTDSVGLHCVKIVKMLPKGKIAPVGYAAPVITKILLHKRKLRLLEKIQKILLDDAKRNKKFKLYEH